MKVQGEDNFSSFFVRECGLVQFGGGGVQNGYFCWIVGQGFQAVVVGGEEGVVIIQYQERYV